MVFFFKRLRLMSGNVTIDDIDDYGRTHEMFSLFISPDSRENEFCEGFNNYTKVVTSALRRQHLVGIPPGETVTVFIQAVIRIT